MRLRFSDRTENFLRYLKLKLLPKTLFFRTMLLIFIPLIVVQVVSIVVFLDSNWGRVGRRFATNVVDDMAYVIALREQAPSRFTSIAELTEKNLQIGVQFYANDVKHTVINKVSKGNKLIIGFLEEALDNTFPDAATGIYLDPKSKDMSIFVDNNSGMFLFSVDERKIFSSSIFGFVIWMVATSLLLFIVATLFLRVQARSIADLAQVAEDFGKGIDNKNFKPYGSSEVRKAAIAFVKMKERINKQISERTQMLAGVSHDLRTPLTRMKLSSEMLLKGKDKEDFMQDIDEMEKMLEGYLSFVSGEAGEQNSFVDFNEMILSIINKFRKTNALIRYSTNDEVGAVQGREQALKRALTNIISNAFRYGKTVAVKLENNNKKLEVSIEDDGPGIPLDKREDVFKAFYRIEGSRNKETGGVGLGLSIAKDVVTSHGGKIELFDSSLGGLKVLVSIPL